MSRNAFNRYAPFIQTYIYRKGWTDLREVQVEACDAILDTDKHVIVASGTASGKTEAAFFPILTLLDQNPSASVGVMYIGPLKALINDQFERLDALLEDSGIPVWPWHGDVSRSVKQRAVREAQGVLQITPESLESLLMSHPGDACRLFSDLRFVVIDEIHALMGQDRGLQVMCLLSRLERLAGCSPRRIGLSATLNEYRSAMDFLAAGTRRETIAVGTKHHKRTIALGVESFPVPADPQQAEAAKAAFHQYIYDHSHNKKCLIFTNSRGDAEQTIASMKEIAAQRQERDVFYVHHGSVSAALRQEAEHALRDHDGPTVAAATLTLELGIDIGDLDATIQTGAPYSCSSFVQRLGRSGRRTGISRMLFVNCPEESVMDGLDGLPWILLRSIAVIQLYLESRWVEPVTRKEKPYSLLVHQTISTLMAHGELSPAELADRVLRLPAFWNRVGTDEYRELLRYLLAADYLQRMEGGGLIVGMKGEKIANHYSFFAVFPDEEAYHVVSKDGEVGTLTRCPMAGDVFALAGRAWQAVAIDDARKTVYASPAQHAKIPSWAGADSDIHAGVVRRMKQVLEENTIYPYLQPNARKVLTDARTFARAAGLLDRDVIPCGDHTFWLCPWAGTKEIRTLEKLLKHGLKNRLDIFSVTPADYYLRVTSGMDPADWPGLLQEELDLTNPDLVLPPDEAPRVDKYDYMVPPDLLRTAYVHDQMDIPAAIRILKSLNTP